MTVDLTVKLTVDLTVKLTVDLTINNGYHGCDGRDGMLLACAWMRAYSSSANVCARAPSNEERRNVSVSSAAESLSCSRSYLRWLGRAAALPFERHARVVRGTKRTAAAPLGERHGSDERAPRRASPPVAVPYAAGVGAVPVSIQCRFRCVRHALQRRRPSDIAYPVSHFSKLLQSQY